MSIRDGLVYARRTKTVAVVLSMLFVISTVSINFNVVLPGARSQSRCTATPKRTA